MYYQFKYKKMYKRTIQDEVEKWLFKGKVIIIYGARQVGKTTLVQEIIKKFGNSARYINCEFLENQEFLSVPSPEKLKNFLGNYKVVVLDEAQKVENIGLVLKILADNFPEMQVIATGSSSFDLSNKVSEPLTGRAIQFTLYPLSAEELKEKYDNLSVSAKLESIMIFGLYPDVFDRTREEAEEKLRSIASNYLYKDIFELENIKKSSLLTNLLQLTALQLGNEVSLGELAVKLNTTPKTVERYLDLLEKTFVIFRLKAFSRNLRNEISNSFKVYFYDLGIRNSIINNINPVSLRQDAGGMWENFCVVERMKKNHNHRIFPNIYFWRTYDQKEIDYVEEKDGRLKAVEFKLGDKKAKVPKTFLNTYPESGFELINKENYFSFIS